MVKLQRITYARMAELADALDLGSSGRPWGFKSLYAHHTMKKPLANKGFLLFIYMIMIDVVTTHLLDLNPRLDAPCFK